jgi:hypothetical protein
MIKFDVMPRELQLNKFFGGRVVGFWFITPELFFSLHEFVFVS